MKYNQVSIDKLIPYARNARTHSDAQVAQLAASIREFGFINPVIIDGDGGIIAGHGRVMAARKLGMTEVPCVEAAHLTDAQKKAYILADNKLSLNAEWDSEMLRIELDELQSMDFDLTLTGFDTNEIECLNDCPDVLFDDNAEKSNSGGHTPNRSVSFWIYDHKITDSRDSTFVFVQNNIERLRKISSEKIADAIIGALHEILD